MLAISTESWHFAYYRWLRGLYGYVEVPDQTSLCPYCQTILWGSIFCMFLSPLLLSGWLMMRLGRWMMKLEGSRLDKLFNRIEKTFLGKAIERGPNNFAEAPLVSGLVYTLLGLSILSASLVAVGSVVALIAVVGMGVWNIGDVLAACWIIVCGAGSYIATALLHVGWGIFWLSGLFGWGMSLVGYGFAWLFTNGELWAMIGSWVLYVILSLAGAGIVGVIIGYGAMLIARTEVVQGINGFAAARKARQERIKEACVVAQKDLPPIICSYCNTENEAMRDTCKHCDRDLPRESKPGLFVAFFIKCIEFVVIKPITVLFGTMERFGKQEIHLLGWVSILIEFIKALKKGVCPIVEFTNPAKLQERAQDGSEERNA